VRHLRDPGTGRPRWQWWLVVLVGLIGTTIAVARLASPLIQVGGAFFRLSLNEQIGVGGLGLSAVALVVGVLQLRQASRSVRPLEPRIDHERHALDRLAAHLGRQSSLPLMGDAPIALALRVHPAINLATSSPPVESAAAAAPGHPPVAAWRWLSTRPSSCYGAGSTPVTSISPPSWSSC
jgi:hypothetical protein